IFGFMWDSPSFWIWLIIVVISFFAQRKKKQTPSMDRDSAPMGPESKPISFEDLLKEIEASKNPQQTIFKEQKPKPQSVANDTDYDDELLEEAQGQERIDYKTRDEDATFDVYEKAKLAAFNRPSLEETMKVEDTEVKFGQFKGYQQEQALSPLHLLVKDLKDPEGFRKAFIMSEILSRKY
ncbi:MAG: hypothetical protein ACKO96_45805, partial [Flammeovirgaceae bacterium]